MLSLERNIPMGLKRQPARALSVEQALGQQVVVSFEGVTDAPPPLLQMLAEQRISGIELFRHKNFHTRAELRRLTAGLQAAAARAGAPPLLVAANQEGGQLITVGDSTPFPGNMALGAAHSSELAEKVGYAMGRELSAVGINVNFAPVADVNNNPDNPVIGTRSFGDDPRLVARLAAAMIHGLQSAGIAATAKHFPGHGDTASDSHDCAPVVPHSIERLRRIELPPFRAAVKAGVKLIMAAHVMLPKYAGGQTAPATLAPAVLRGLLRRDLGYGGVITTDAMDMRALDQGPAFSVEAMAALAAGSDLVLLHQELARVDGAFPILVQAIRRGFLSADDMRASALRIQALKQWLARTPPAPLSVVGCREHLELAREVGRRAVTLVRDRVGRLPLRLPAKARVAVVVPRPEDLTPADTSSYETPALGAAVRRHHRSAEEFAIAMNPEWTEVRTLLAHLRDYDLVIVGTINAAAHAAQATFVNGLLEQHTPTVAVALRMPYDITAYPEVATYACTYSILRPALDALADALWGEIPFAGKLPVTLPRLRS
jgi:beta-N-acetylhexosaminidase